MKTFWIIVGLLAALTAAVFLVDHPRGASVQPDQPAGPVAKPADSDTPAPIESDAAAWTPVAATSLVPPAPQSALTSDAPVSAPSQPGDGMLALSKDLTASYNSRPDSEKGDVDAALASESPPAATKPDQPHAESAQDNPGGPKIEHRPDGSLLLDGRFVVRGAGTENDPYRITWELLVSAKATFAPRLGMLDIPARISFLDGKHVRITGYLFAPMVRTGVSEMLVARNMWDGCCIGVPPTTYDSIEVKLGKPASEDVARADFGTLDGVLKVDPLVQDGWVVGLYVVENGTIDVGEK